MNRKMSFEVIPMSVGEWSKSSVEYGRKLVDSGLEGAHAGEEEFLHGESLAPFLGKFAQRALVPAAVGACLGVLGSRPWNGHRSAGRAFAFAFLGGAIGFAAGLGWESRCLTASVASGAMKSIGKTRDDHWFERNPIDYA
jgi:hypothetical protein